MPNLNGVYQEAWSNDVQDYLNKSLTAFGLAGFNFVENGKQKYHRPILSDVYATTYTPGTALTAQNASSSDEYIEANIIKAAHLFVEDSDQLETSYSLYGALVPQAAQALKNEIDASFYLEAANNNTNASRVIVDADLSAGGNNGYVTLTSTNVLEAISIGKYALHENNVSDTIPFATSMTPRGTLLVEIALAKAGSNVGDTTLRNGYTRTIPTLGVDVYMSNNIRHDYSISTALVADDVIVIAGVSLKAVATPSAAGEFKLAKFNEMLTGTGVPGTDYIEVSQADRAKLNKYKLSASGSAGTVGTVITSSGRVSISITGTGVVGAARVLFPVMQRGAVDLVVQKQVQTEFQRGTNKGVIGTYLMAWTKFGVKKFADGAEKVVLIKSDK